MLMDGIMDKIPANEWTETVKPRPGKVNIELLKGLM
jgi:hypothetical protein